VLIHQVPQPGAVLVDIRHPDEISRQPLKAGNVSVIEVPFYELDKKSAEFEAATEYMLYCDRGVMSRLHAELLREKGLENISVYRPAS
jgi:thiamine biosynthesis protein ThiI